MSRWRGVPALAVSGLLMLRAAPAAAVDPAEVRGKAEASIRSAEVDSEAIRAAMEKAKRKEPTAEKRIVAGELLMRTGDFEGAIHTFCQVIELHRRGKVGEAAYADALFLLAEAYFRDEQHLSSARHYKEVVEKGMRSPYAAYVGRSLSRLVDVSIRTHHGEVLDYVFAKLHELPPTDAAGSLQYARGKAYLARNDLASARRSFESVPKNGDFTHQAGYALGVVATKEGLLRPPPTAEKGKPSPSASVQRFTPAIEQFHRVTQLPPDSDAHRQVIDLSWMAIGRVFYETENYLDSADAYSHVDRASAEFNDMLYELAWVYVRLGDTQRAERALEVLSITAPENLNLGDTSLLRADLLLRAGKFERALELYEGVRQEFDPMRSKVDAFIETTTDPGVYYDRLVNADDFSDDKEGLPKTVLKWVREAAADDRAFFVVDDINRSKSLMKKSKELVKKLRAVMRSRTRVRAFPDLKAGLERTAGLINRVALARRSMAEGLDEVHPGEFGGELGQVRRERRQMMRRMSMLPVAEGDFLRRDAIADRQWTAVSQKLQGLTIEADRLQAIINALRTLIDGSDKNKRDPSVRERIRSEIEASERELSRFREAMSDYRDAIDVGRAQVGFGDQRFVEDAEIRVRFREILRREVDLEAHGRGDGDTAAYAASLVGILSRADAADARLTAIQTDLEEKVRIGADEIQKMIEAEAENLRGYAEHLEELDGTARVLIGEAAKRNFALVRDRLKSIVLRADVGMVQQAWEMREQQRLRVRDLQRERAHEEQNLNDELREVLDDAGGQQ